MARSAGEAEREHELQPVVVVINGRFDHNQSSSVNGHAENDLIPDCQTIDCDDGMKRGWANQAQSGKKIKKQLMTRMMRLETAAVAAAAKR